MVRKLTTNDQSLTSLRSHIQFGKTVASRRLNEKTATWTTEFENGSQLESRHIVAGNGGLRIPNIPDFPGRIATLYPYNARTWRKAMRRVHVQDFELKTVAS